MDRLRGDVKDYLAASDAGRWNTPSRTPCGSIGYNPCVRAGEWVGQNQSGLRSRGRIQKRQYRAEQMMAEWWRTLSGQTYPSSHNTWRMRKGMPFCVNRGLPDARQRTGCRRVRLPPRRPFARFAGRSETVPTVEADALDPGTGRPNRLHGDAERPRLP